MSRFAVSLYPTNCLQSRSKRDKTCPCRRNEILPCSGVHLLPYQACTFYSRYRLLQHIVTKQYTNPSAISNCTCGFSVNDTSSEHHAVFTDLDEIDFLHIRKLTEKSITWARQEYNTTAVGARGPNGKMALLQNVIENPLRSIFDWGGQGFRGGEPGLQLWVRSSIVDGMVSIGEIAAKRTDVLYGSFRVAMKVTQIHGTCGAFFWVSYCLQHVTNDISTNLYQFRNNTQEIDMEFLSSQFNDSYSVNLVLQSPASTAAGYDASKTPSFLRYILPFNPAGGFHEYRFDWLPDRVSFYADGHWLHDMTENVPDSPGHLMLNHWSNGDPRWSGGPPASDAVLTVSYIKAYFNSSDPTRQGALRKGCSISNMETNVCKIPDQAVAPDTGGVNGNTTARTFFFSKDPLAAAVNASAYEPHSGSSSPVSLLFSWRFLFSATLISLIMGPLISLD